MTCTRFDFGLSPEQEDRARRLHAESIVIDLMFQGPCSAASIPDESFADLREQWRRSESPDVFSLAWIRSAQLAGEDRMPEYRDCWQASGLTGTNLQIAAAGDQSHQARLKEFETHAAWYGQALRAEDFRIAKREGRCVSFLGHQNVAPGVANLDWFDRSHAAGVRMCGLTYNNPNTIGVGCTGNDTGLTTFGREAVSHLNALGMIVDVAHAGRQTTLDACRHSQAPVIASHSGAEAVYQHNRNKSDEEIRALADCGGLIGVMTVPDFLTATPPGKITHSLDQIDYIADLVGINHVALGSDWPMQLPAWVLSNDGPLRAWALAQGFGDGDISHFDAVIEGFAEYRDLPNITRGLVARGYRDEEIAKILGGNALRVFEAVCG